MARSSLPRSYRGYINWGKTRLSLSVYKSQSCNTTNRSNFDPTWSHYPCAFDGGSAPVQPCESHSCMAFHTYCRVFSPSPGRLPVCKSEGSSPSPFIRTNNIRVCEHRILYARECMSHIIIIIIVNITIGLCQQCTWYDYAHYLFIPGKQICLFTVAPAWANFTIVIGFIFTTCYTTKFPPSDRQ